VAGMSPMRILHVMGRMNRGGIETWLMHVLRSIDRNRFHMDFLVHTTQPSDHDEEIVALGSQVIPCMHPSSPLTYARNFKRIVRESGPYHIVHSHVHHFNGYVLRLAYQAGVPVRIAHSHNDMADVDAKARLKRRLYVLLMAQWISRYATIGLACSENAGRALFRRRLRNKRPWGTLYYGIDLAPFNGHVSSSHARDELGVGSGTFVVGHVGSFRDEQKNHDFIVQIAAEVARRDSHVRFLLVGDGALRRTIEKRVVEMGLADRVVFAGLRADVPRLMMSAMDAFLLPSLWEGLPLVLLEAQAAGLPCVISDTITEEADVVPQLICRLSPNQAASVWAGAVLDMKAARPLAPSQAKAQMMKSAFTTWKSRKALERLYETL
jgi:glycosyltransferase involved in cell wall biosynthesis